jgi:hypothetical protein
MAQPHKVSHPLPRPALIIRLDLFDLPTPGSGSTKRVVDSLQKKIDYVLEHFSEEVDKIESIFDLY